MSQGTLTAPLLKEEGTAYRVEWVEGVTVECRRLYEHRDRHIEAVVTISDSAELNGPLLLGPIRTHITKTWRGIISELEAISARDDWRQRMTQVAALVTEAYLAGSPAIALDDAEPPEPSREVINRILWQGTPCIIFGAGGIGKSLVGLNLIQALHSGIEVAGLPTVQQNTMWLDWETTRALAYWRNSEILSGRGIEPGRWPDPERPDSPRGRMVFYREMVGPLSDHVETLSDEIEEYNIGTILVDSAIPACGGEAEATKPTQDFFTALRAIKPSDRDLSALIIAHVTKESTGSKANATPFGSTVWKDRARDTFELKASQHRNARYTDFALHHRKSNMGPLHDPLGLRLTWEEGCTIEALDIQENAELVAGLPIAERARITIGETGPMTTEELAEVFDSARSTVASALSRDHRFVSANGRWEPSESDW